MYRLLIVDDEAGHRAGLIGLLRMLKPEYLVFEAENGAVALTMMDVMEFDLVLTDIRMPQMDGLDFLAHAKAKHACTRIAILSAYSLFDYARRSVALGADDYLLKPVDADELSQCLDRMENRLERQPARDGGHGVGDGLQAFVTGSLSEAEQAEMRALFPGGDAGVVFTVLPIDGWIDEERRDALWQALRVCIKALGSAMVFRSSVERDALIGIVVCSKERINAVRAQLEAELSIRQEMHGQRAIAGICALETDVFGRMADAHTRARAACMQHFFDTGRVLFELPIETPLDPFSSLRLDVPIKVLDASLCAGDVE